MSLVALSSVSRESPGDCIAAEAAAEAYFLAASS